MAFVGDLAGADFLPAFLTFRFAINRQGSDGPKHCEHHTPSLQCIVELNMARGVVLEGNWHLWLPWCITAMKLQPNPF
jgi:hypothetical protein